MTRLRFWVLGDWLADTIKKLCSLLRKGIVKVDIVEIVFCFSAADLEFCKIFIMFHNGFVGKGYANVFCEDFCCKPEAADGSYSFKIGKGTVFVRKQLP